MPLPLWTVAGSSSPRPSAPKASRRMMRTGADVLLHAGRSPRPCSQHHCVRGHGSKVEAQYCAAAWAAPGKDLCSRRKHDRTSRSVNMKAVLRRISRVALCNLLADASLQDGCPNELYRQVRQPAWLLEWEARFRMIILHPHPTRIQHQNNTNKFDTGNLPSALISKTQYGCVACSASS